MLDLKSLIILFTLTFLFGFKSAMIYNDSKRASELDFLSEVKQTISKNQAEIGIQLENFKNELTNTYENVKIKEINTIVEKPVYKNIAIDNDGVEFLEKNRQELQNKRQSIK